MGVVVVPCRWLILLICGRKSKLLGVVRVVRGLLGGSWVLGGLKKTLFRGTDGLWDWDLGGAGDLGFGKSDFD